MKKRNNVRKQLKHGFKKYLIENYRLYTPTDSGKLNAVLIGDTGMNLKLSAKVLPRIPVVEYDQFIYFFDEIREALRKEATA